MIKAIARIAFVFTAFLISNNLATNTTVQLDSPAPMCIPGINCSAH